MAKTFLATEYEIRQLMDGDLGVCEVHTDWYRHCFTATIESILDGPLRIEFPIAMARDAFDSSIIPGSISALKDSTVNLLMERLGVDLDEDYIFFVMTGRFHRAHDGDPMRFILCEPRRARHVLLMASWQKDAASPQNRDNCFLAEAPVVRSAYFEDDPDVNTAAWVLQTISPLGGQLATEAQADYENRVRSGIEHFKGYTSTCSKVRDDLWERLCAMSHDAPHNPPSGRLTLCERYAHAEWHDVDDEVCDDYYFYTNVGVEAILDFARTRIDNGTTTTLVRMF